MSINWDISKRCSGCTACVSICPTHCITMEADEEGFLYPVIDTNKCIKCGLCQKVCMIGRKKERRKVLNTYAASNSDMETRKECSSGGIFALLAENIILNNGVVFGAIFSDDCKKVDHIVAHSRKDLKKMFGSKYVQSNLGNIYLQVKKELCKGKMVLFSGTPCQINGLYLFLNHEYENLFLVDVVCHGVPSPLLWNKYIERIEKKYRSTVVNVNFRNKNYGWKDFGVKTIAERKSELFISKDEDPYMQMFLKNYCLRPSCYQCDSKEQRYSDITLGDFWGIENFFPEMDDGSGTSAIIIRTEKGKMLFDQLKSKVTIKETKYSSIVQFNSAEIKSVYKPIQRESFFRDVNSMSFASLQKKYLKKPLKKKIREILIKIGLWRYIRNNSKWKKSNKRYFVTFVLEQSSK